ncbi:gene transfer agent family protein [Roseivivax sp. THAF197b]|uniref:gene transfer agent family protein n=1 Tax=Roseivivax sp. THAF197b TaxID=2588299 RepID=UPI0012684F00|nr:gene transfer agent family protein [Roseivivax sp. THAF197b]QFS82337.1 hypothetical protein FIV09_05815 [Roseivivax sp. THAF197b]
MTINVRAFFGDAERDFALTDHMIEELERLSDAGIGLIYRRATAMQFGLKDITETLRLALIGAGTPPEEAERLVTAWCRNRPIAETLPLALDVLDARWSGAPAKTSDAA